MNIFNFVLIPLSVLLFFLISKQQFKKEYYFAIFGSCIAFVLVLLIDFPISWTISKSVSPIFSDLFVFSFWVESLLPIGVSLLFYWLLRGSFFKKNTDLTFTQIFLYFVTFFYLFSLVKIVHYRFNPDFLQIIFLPILRALIAFTGAQLLFLGEKVRSVWLSIFIISLFPIYGLVASFAYGAWYSFDGIYLFLIMPIAVFVPLIIFLAGMPYFVDMNLIQFFKRKKSL